MDTIKIGRPDDFHGHLRQGALMRTILPHYLGVFGRVLAMPNTQPYPVLNAEDVHRYRRQIMSAIKAINPNSCLEPMIAIQGMERTDRRILKAARDAGARVVKVYPEDMTHSDCGVKDYGKLSPMLEAAQNLEMIVLFHGELPGKEIISFDAEEAFLPIFHNIATSFPRLRVILEHITTKSAVECVSSLPDNAAATITPHHLVLTFDDVARRWFRPHNYCMPIAKRYSDREALIKAATSGNPKIFLGTDSAAHPWDNKECEKCCAGVFNIPVALPLLAQVFEERGALDKLEGFTSLHGARFYGLEPNEGTIVLERRPFTVPEPEKAKGVVVPFWAGKTVSWSLKLD